MNEKIAKIKSKIEKRLPEIATVAAFIAAVTYAFCAKNSSNEEETDEKTVYIALNDCCFQELKNGESVVWKIGNQMIDLAYDPYC